MIKRFSASTTMCCLKPTKPKRRPNSSTTAMPLPTSTSRGCCCEVLECEFHRQCSRGGRRQSANMKCASLPGASLIDCCASLSNRGPVVIIIIIDRRSRGCSRGRSVTRKCSHKRILTSKWANILGETLARICSRVQHHAAHKSKAEGLQEKKDWNPTS